MANMTMEGPWPEIDLFKLGAQPSPQDERTLRMADHFDFRAASYPTIYDFDLKRLPFPVHSWGNGEYGDCVKATEADALVRFNRVESRQTLQLRDEDAVVEYKLEQQREFGQSSSTPGDQYDQGLVPLYNWKNWRNIGWLVKLPSWNQARAFKIAAFGSLQPRDFAQLKSAIFNMHGIALSIDLPISAYYQIGSRVWDVATGPDAVPGSWGGHEVYCKKYDDNHIYCKTWGMEIAMTWPFVQKYVTEAWAFVDDLDPWRSYHYFNVESMLQHLKDVGAIEK